MKLWEILLIVACAALVVGVVVAAVVRKVRGKSGCDCDCDCASCGMCSHISVQSETDNASEPAQR